MKTYLEPFLLAPITWVGWYDLGFHRSKQRQGKGSRVISVSAREGLSSKGARVQDKGRKTGIATIGCRTKVVAPDSGLWV